MMQFVIIGLAGFVAGIINSIAGGGTLISFPALLWIGRNPIIANATNTVAIWPGSFAGVIGFRKQLALIPRWLLFLTIPALAGGIAGAVLLLHTSQKTFANLVPFLILGATILLAAQEVITRRLTILKRLHDEHAGAFGLFAFVFQFFVSVYGGYFGAGMGILMLAALGLIGMNDMLKMNGLKNLLAICINGVAAVYFMVAGAVVWRDVAIMAVTSIAGGFLGARLAVRFGKKFVRAAVVIIGLVMTVAMFVKR